MAYSVYADLAYQLPAADLIELTDDAGSGSVDTDIITRAIEDSDAEIDAYLSARYDLPLSTTPGLIRRLSVDLSICWLYARRSSLVVPETWQERCRMAREMLEKIALGTLSIADLSDTTDYGISATTDKDDRIFTMGRDSDDSSGTLDNY
jgi:Mu-like prophage protein gp36